MMRDPEQTIGNLIDRQNTSFVGSVDEDGYPEVKAMLPPRKREGIRTFYFTSNTSSMRAAHYRAHPQACIYFVDRRFFRGVMLKGTMEVLEDAWAKELISARRRRNVLSAGGDRSRLLRAALHGRARPLLPELQLRGFRRAGCVTCQLGAARATGGSARGSARAPRRSCRPSF